MFIKKTKHFLVEMNYSPGFRIRQIIKKILLLENLIYLSIKLRNPIIRSIVDGFPA